jgi:hypothetical protein
VTARGDDAVLSQGEYVHVPSRRKARAVLTARVRAPAGFYARLASQAVRNGLPAARRFGRARALVARAGVPTRPLAHAVALCPRGPAPALDRLLRDLEAAWPELSARGGLPRSPPPLAAAALRRTSSLTVFVFGDSAEPLLVAKVPGAADRLAAEAAALVEAEPARVSPRFLGRAGAAFIQEAVAGTPLDIEPVTPESASRAAWSPTHGEVADALVRLAEATAKPEPPEELDVTVRAALEAGMLAEPSRRALVAAWSDVRPVRTSVLRHRDTSPQNCLVRGGSFAALVDWEAATSRGAPGFDTWNAALASLEGGIGLVAWSDETVLASFRAAWADSPLFAHGRAAARRAAVAAGMPERVLDQLELVFFARRLGVRVAAPSSWATGPATVARMLEFAHRS